MSKIHVMSESLANKIAAGEVVERISSVVKELVENSIDAGSREIIVDLIDSGTKSIKVIDDGSGMDKEDARLAFTRHATSKLLKEDDLFFINTLGFRGEALPSIASVSKVLITTSQGDMGYFIEMIGGEIKKEESVPAKKGTTIEVNDLFFNTPARLKYLKSDVTELSSVTSFIERLALTSPNISFTLINNGRRIVYTSGSDDLLKTIHELFGYQVSSNMISIYASNDDYDISGYICKPQVLKSNRNHMITIVNNRIVKNNDINRAINEGYFTFKPDIKYPVVVIKIDTDPTLVDVNIHPTKQDIKISKIDVLTKMISETINESLKRTLLIPKIDVVKDYLEDDEEIITNNSTELLVSEDKEETIQEQITLDFKTYEDVREEVDINSDKSNEVNELVKKLELYPQGVVFGTYIICQNDEGMYLIDQHAAQERVNYERVLNGLKNSKLYTTSLLIPITIELSGSDALKIKENMELLSELGFKVEEFGVNTYKVSEHPTWLIEGLEEESVRKIFEIIIEGKYLFDRVRFNDHIAATMACKMSVKGNEAITMEQAEQIISDLVLCDNPYNCPHGRPTIIKFTKYELERMFKRVMN